LGTLADSLPGCTAAVGPGAALAAAHGDGTVDAYTEPSAFVADGMRLACPLTLVDAGNRSDQVISALAARNEVTLIVTGVGPAPGSADPALQVIYRLRAAQPGYLTSDSTRRDGVVTLTDLTRALVEFGRSGQPPLPVAIDGSPFEVRPAALSLAGIDRHLQSVAALSDAVVTAYLALAALGTVLVGILLASLWARRYRVAEAILTFGTTLPAGLTLTGAAPWAQAGAPAAALVLAFVGWSVLLTAAAPLVGRAARLPAAIGGAGRGGRDRARDRGLPGLAEHGQRLRWGDRADPAGAVAAAGPVRGAGHRAPAAGRGAGRGLGGRRHLRPGLAARPGRRSHLGNFVQRILDGDALAVVARKAAASYATIVDPVGLAALVVGAAAWVVIFRLALPRLRSAFPTLRPVAVAVLATAVLGTLLNDGGISVWIMATAVLAVTVAWFAVHCR